MKTKSKYLPRTTLHILVDNYEVSAKQILVYDRPIVTADFSNTLEKELLEEERENKKFRKQNKHFAKILLELLCRLEEVEEVRVCRKTEDGWSNGDYYRESCGDLVGVNKFELEKLAKK